jgi:Spherulation-specific family 4
MAALLPSGTGSALSVASASAATTPGLTPLIPAYYPATGKSTDPWQTVPPAALANKTPAVEVMNADSGPGTNIGITDPTAAGLAAYQAAITTAHAYGSRVYGYVWTNYANAGSGPAAPISTIENQINQWVAYYPGIDGVFFDATSTQMSGVSFYQTIDTYATSMGLKVIFNPGAVPAQSYMSIDPTSIVVDFEGTGATYTRTSFPSWTASYAPARFANLVYATGSGSVSTIASRARKNNVGNLYVTNGTLPNPWGQLASYFFSAELPAFAPK